MLHLSRITGIIIGTKRGVEHGNFDSHTHLNDTPYQGQEADFIAAAKELGVTQMAIVGSDTKMNHDAIALADKFAPLYAIVGWHPEFAIDYTPEAEATLLKQLEHPKVVALGEIGLDYHWNTSPREIQRRVFGANWQLRVSTTFPSRFTVAMRLRTPMTY